jgi:hypothetical protein
MSTTIINQLTINRNFSYAPTIFLSVYLLGSFIGIVWPLRLAVFLTPNDQDKPTRARQQAQDPARHRPRGVGLSAVLAPFGIKAVS